MGASNLKLILISSTWDCTTFHSFNVKKVFQKLAGLWLAGEMVNRMWIYGSKAEGLSSFQRRSCWVMQRRRICIAVFQITGNSVVCLTVCSSQQQRTHQNFAILALYKAIHRRPTGGFTSQRTTVAENFPCHYVIMSVSHYRSMRSIVVSRWWFMNHIGLVSPIRSHLVSTCVVPTLFYSIARISFLCR